MRRYFVYIMANGKNGTLYIGVTANIFARVRQHKNDQFEGFTKKYGLKMLVYVEETNDIRVAIQAEKRFKNWKREWKIALIESKNPSWSDLSEKLC